MEIETTDIITAVAVVIFNLVGMRLMYGYWPWQTHRKQKPQQTEVVSEEAMRQNVETVFREQGPSLKPFSEADMIDETKPKIDTDEGKENKEDH
jgi:hypothetical protein